jgi:hypothetical protein
MTRTIWLWLIGAAILVVSTGAAAWAGKFLTGGPV